MKTTKTIYEIAKESGVSVATVSRVINKNPRVSEEKREKVQGVMQKYQYTPNPIARAMTSKQTQTIGVILPDITNPYFSSLFLEIERYTLAHKYSVILCNTLFGGSSHGVQSPFGEQRYFEMMREKRVEGVIVIGGQLDLEDVSKDYIDALNNLNRQIPVVVIGQYIEGCECLFLSRNLGGGVAALVQHLAALGNQRIGFVGGQVGVRQTSARLVAFRQTMASLGLPCDDSQISLSDFYTPDGFKAMNRLLKTKPDIQAVIAINDHVALGAIRAIRDAKMNVPSDIAVVSCDEFLDGEFQSPRLTTLNQQNDYLGRLSILMLMGAISGTSETMHINHAPQLVIRESCGAELGVRGQ